MGWGKDPARGGDFQTRREGSEGFVVMKAECLAN